MARRNVSSCRKGIKTGDVSKTKTLRSSVCALSYPIISGASISLSSGRPHKILTVIHEYARDALTVSIHTNITSEHVLEALYPLLLKHGKLEFLRSGNGAEFISPSFQAWLERVCIEPIRIYPGLPWENG